MGVQGRKLTIRMPDNPRLRSAEVGKIHLDPGARVQAGNPVLTLVHRRRDHLVRAPRSGRILPLIATGDRVTAGDPLYILHIDEAALEQQNRAEQKALIAVEKEKWSSGVLADAIEPIQRSRAPEAPSGSEFVTNWGKPVLAIALYVLACFALLPILSYVGQHASTAVLIAMAAGCVAFGALIYYLYAPEAGKWPRRTVRLVAASWIGISALALFYQPKDPSDLEFDSTAGQIAGLFDWSDAPLSRTPQPAPEPQAIILSGVAVGPTETASAPDLNAPVTALAQFDQVIVPHGVTVRGWGRVNPGTAPGDEIDLPLEDAEALPVARLARTVRAALLTEASPGDPALAEALRDKPDAIERADLLLADASTSAPVAAAQPGEDGLRLAEISPESLASQPRPDTPTLAAASLAGAASQKIRSEQPSSEPDTIGAFEMALILDDRAPAASAPVSRHGLTGPLSRGPDLARADPARPAERLSPALNLYSAIQASDATWIDDAGTPSLDTRLALAGLIGAQTGAPQARADLQRMQPAADIDSAATRTTSPPLTASLAVLKGGSAQPEPRDRADWIVSTASGRAEAGRLPAQVSGSRSPDLLLIASVRAGEDVWMLDQSDLLDRAATGAGRPAATPNTQTTRLAALDSGRITATGDLQDRGITVTQDAALAMSVLPVLDGQLRGADAPGLDLPELGGNLANVNGVAASPLVLAAIGDPQPRPRRPLDPVPEALAGPAVERDLLYLYFDDPRIDSHPRLGDPWLGIVSEDLAGGIRSTEVVGVHEILQVQNWCGAANDPDGRKRAQLGDDYTTAWLNDRIRLLRVRMRVAPDRIALLENEVPLFDGTPAGFFHNRAPLMGGLPDEPLMERGRDYLRSLSAGLFDPNAPDQVGGGQYFDSAIALSVILRGAGCDSAQLNEGAGPSNSIGRTLAQRLGG
ncbi:MAG: hypothetical protein AAGD13_01415 [Pseudomonadota bacterium]